MTPTPGEVFQAMMIIVFTLCGVLGGFFFLRDALRRQRRPRQTRPERFAEDPRNWQRQFEKYDRPPIMRRDVQ